MIEKILGYARVSTSKQLKGPSIEIQKEAMKQYCKVHNLDLIKIYTDEGLSAYKKRPNYETMLRKLFNEQEISGVVVHDLTRFGRSTEDLLLQIKKIDKEDKKFISIKDNIDISSKSGRLMLGMLSLIADYERETIVERLVAGKEWAKIHGTKSGKPMHRPLKLIDWARVKELKGYGLSWTKTAKEVGVSTPTLVSRARDEGYYD